MRVAAFAEKADGPMIFTDAKKPKHKKAEGQQEKFSHNCGGKIQ
jgi:hypothetical protein